MFPYEERDKDGKRVLHSGDSPLGVLSFVPARNFPIRRPPLSVPMNATNQLSHGKEDALCLSGALKSVVVDGSIALS